MPYDRPGNDIWWDRSDMWDPPGWGFHSDQKVRSTEWVLSLLAEVRSWNGNLLVSWAPGPDGTTPDAYYAGLAEREDWMGHRAESIFGCGAGPYPESCTIPATSRDGVIYLHFTSLDIISARLSDVPKPKAVRELRTRRDLGYVYTDRVLTVDRPKDSPLVLNNVVQVLL